ncbi:hypothetical protein HF086_001186 [Spodoptera exigua]|uniref:Kazal-like domain-containing protein n=1 Tax=Spodoptera exigua TaxID=7107 RepID=A0A922MCN8_SPOEX|nr:hypothetical protein HF086_001186 [Spodoptera exigua]
MAELNDGTQIIKAYKNICFMKKKECELGSLMEINQIDDEFCNIRKKAMTPEEEAYKRQTRRVEDPNVIGAFQACNHTCPLTCTEAYEPVCAEIWNGTTSSDRRTMVNHCHVDMFSCVTGLNVTIQQLYSCYTNPRVLLFMQKIAIMNSLNLLGSDLPPPPDTPRYSGQSGRRTNSEQAEDMDDETLLKKHLEEVVRRIFNKYNNYYYRLFFWTYHLYFFLSLQCKCKDK